MTDEVIDRQTVEIVGDTSGLAAAYEDATAQAKGFESSLSSIGSSLTGIGTKWSLAVTAPLALAGASMITLAGDAAETQSKFEQVFGEMSADVEAWADSYGDSVGRASTDLKDMLATADSIVKAMGMVGEEGAEFSETIAQLSIDMGSFHNTTDLEAFTALRSAITGEYEPMKRFGVVINEAKVAQELLTMGVEGGTAAATDAEKAQARMNIILRATTDAQGDAERTAGSYSNQMKALQADLKETSEALGRELLPLAQDALSVARDAIGWVGDLDEGTQKAVVTTGLFAAAIGPATLALGAMAGGVSNLITLYRTYQASTIASTIATKGLTAAIASNPIGLAGIGATTLATAFFALSSSTDEATEAQKAYNEAVGVSVDVTKLSNEELQDRIDKLEEEARQNREAAAVLRGETTPATEKQTAATSNVTNATEGLNDATGNQIDSFRDALKASKEHAAGLQMVQREEKETAAETLEATAEQNDQTAAAYKQALALRSLASGAEEAYKRASSAVKTHQEKVSALQDEYTTLKQTIDDALSIDSDIEDAGRDVERADIRKQEAQADLDDLNREIAEKEQELATTDYGSIDAREDAEKELAALKLRQRSAVLDLADAQDAYTDALKKQSDEQTKKTQIEKDLNGESIDSAQDRLDVLSQKIQDETDAYQGALNEREAAQQLHETFVNDLNNQSLTTQADNWATYVEWLNNNPAIARTFQLAYDENGDLITSPAKVEDIDIQAPEFQSLSTGGSAALSEAIAAGTYNYSHNATGGSDVALNGASTEQAASSSTTTPSSNEGGVTIGTMIVNSPKADAATMAYETRRALRTIGSQASGV